MAFWKYNTGELLFLNHPRRGYCILDVRGRQFIPLSCRNDILSHRYYNGPGFELIYDKESGLFIPENDIKFIRMIGNRQSWLRRLESAEVDLDLEKILNVKWKEPEYVPSF